MIFENQRLAPDLPIWGSRVRFSWKLVANDFRATRDQVVGDLTAGDPPVPIPNTEVKPRRADCTARESVWESRSLPA